MLLGIAKWTQNGALLAIVCFSGIFFLAIHTLAIDCILADQPAKEVHKSGVRFGIYIFDVSTSTKTARVEIRVWLDDFPMEADRVHIEVYGGGQTQEITCVGIGHHTFQAAKANETIWFLEGPGEAFPFDVYSLSFQINERVVFYSLNESFYHLEEPWEYEVNLDMSWATFCGARVTMLCDTWVNDAASTDTSAIPVRASDTIYTLLLQREWQTPFLQILLPIIACYYLLASSLILHPVDRLEARLRIYLSLFVFSPTFFFAIQPFLPYRSTLSIPELLLTNLLLNNAVFGIFAMVANWWIPRLKEERKIRIFERVPDFLASFVCSQAIYIFLLKTIFEKISVHNLGILLLFTLPVYVASGVLLMRYFLGRIRIRHAREFFQ